MSNNISGKFNLMQLKAAIKMINGKDGLPLECVVIPVEANHLFKG